MKIAKIRISSLVILFSLTGCIVDGSWLGLVGRWQDVEYPALEMEFTQSGQFTEYFYGEVRSHGDFEADGDTITLHYAPPCGGENEFSCNVRLRFTVTEDTLIITDSEGDFRYKKVD